MAEMKVQVDVLNMDKVTELIDNMVTMVDTVLEKAGIELPDLEGMTVEEMNALIMEKLDKIEIDQY